MAINVKIKKLKKQRGTKHLLKDIFGHVDYSNREIKEIGKEIQLQLTRLTGEGSGKNCENY